MYFQGIDAGEVSFSMDFLFRSRPMCVFISAFEEERKLLLRSYVLDIN